MSVLRGGDKGMVERRTPLCFGGSVCSCLPPRVLEGERGRVGAFQLGGKGGRFLAHCSAAASCRPTSKRRFCSWFIKTEMRARLPSLPSKKHASLRWMMQPQMISPSFPKASNLTTDDGDTTTEEKKRDTQKKERK